MHILVQRCKSLRVNSLLWLSLFLFLLMLAPFEVFAQNRLLSRQVPSATSQSRAIEHLSNETHLNLAISLPLRNAEELDTLAADVSNPTSPHYRHYWTAAQFAAEFGPTPEDYQAVTDFARSNNLTIMGTHSNRVVLTVSGTTVDVERAFNVKMMVYEHPTRGRFYAPDREPTVNLGVAIEHVAGLDNFEPPRPMDLKLKPLTNMPLGLTGSGPNGLLQGTDFRAAYAPGVTQTGLGQTVALLEFDGLLIDDVNLNFDNEGVNRIPVQTVLLDGFDGTPHGEEAEVVLDIMMSSFMAPGLQSVISYEGYVPDDILDQIATDDSASQISSSWQFGFDATTEQIFQEFIVQGQSFVQSSGDSGAYPGEVQNPSDDPNITIVGGTDLSTAGAGGPWNSEYAWSGSGGGVSTVYPIPSYQQGTSMATNGGSTTMRNLPDVAAVATDIFLICNDDQAVWIGGTSASAPLWAGFIALANQEAQTNGQSSVGFLNPIIYSLGNGSTYTTDFNDITTGSNGFMAVSGYDLATGWGSPNGQSLVDAISQAGLAEFQIALANSALTIYPTYTANTTASVQYLNGFTGLVNFTASGLPAGVTASFAPASTASSTLLTLSANGGAAPGIYTIAVTGTVGITTYTQTIQLSIAQPALTLAASVTTANLLVGGPGMTTTISISNEIGLPGNVKLSVTGVPRGLKVSFSSTSISAAGTSVLTFTPNAAVSTGQFTMLIIGTSGSATSTVPVQLNIPPPTLSLSPATATLSLAAGSTVNDSIVVSAGNLANNVTLSTSSMPGGLTASFSPSTVIAAGGSSSVTFAADDTVSPGTYSINVAGKSGATTVSAPMQVTVTASFSLSASPASLALVAGGSNTSSTITVTGSNGFNSSVALTTSGLPSGLSGSFSPASTMGTSVLTLAASVGVAAGTYPVTISGTLGSSIITTTVQVAVSAPSFNLASSISALTLVEGGASGSSTITVTELNGFNSPVALTASGLPSGVTATFSPASTTSQSVLTVGASTSATPGTYTATVTGTAGPTSTTVNIQLTIPTPSFTLSSSPNSLSLGAGSSSSSTISVVPVNGFNSSVALTASGLPSGLTASFSPTNTSGSSILTLTSSTSAPAGTYPIVINATSGSLSTSTTLQVTILSPSFSLSSSSSSVRLAVGGASSTVTIGLVSPANLAGSVVLNISGLPAGITASFSPVSTTSTSALTLTPSNSAIPGVYGLTVQGVSGSVSAITTIQLTVPTPTFGLTTSAGTVTLLDGGSGASTTVNVVGQNGFNSSVALTASGAPSGVTAAFSSTNTSTASGLTFTPSASVVPGIYPISISGISGSETASTTVLLSIPMPTFSLSTSPTALTLQVGGAAGSSTVNIAAQNGYSNVVLSTSGLPGGLTASFTPSSATRSSQITLSPTASVAPGVYTVAIIGTSASSSASTSLQVTVPAPSFTLSVQATNLTVPAGSSSSDLITVSPLNGFTANVALSISGLPAGVTASFTPATISKTGSLSLAVGSATASGTYPLTIKGTSGSLSSTVTLQLTIPAPSFTLSSAKSSMTLLVGGSSGTTVLTLVRPVNLPSAVALSVTGLPIGISSAFSPSSTTSTSTLILTPTVNAVPGTYTVTAKGSSGSTTSSVNILLTVPAPSFTLSSSSSSLSMQVSGATVASTITIVKPLNLANAVALTIAGVPHGITAAFSPSSTSSTSILTFTPSASAVPGVYSVKVTGTSAGIAASATILLNIPAPNFALTAASEPTLHVGGSAATSTVSVVDQNGFSGIVSLTVSGLPAGITASFSPASTSSTSKLALTPSLKALVGSYSATVKGISGTITSSITVPFTVSK